MAKPSLQHVDQKKKDKEPNIHLLHLAVLRQQTNKRAGTASTKTRAEVRGGGKKPWRQKGTGRARVGSIRSPLWVGGGITFGPKPRSYKIALPKKARNLAIRDAFLLKKDEIVRIKNLPEIKDCKTKNFLAAMKTFGQIKFPLLLIAKAKDSNFEEIRRATNNLQYVTLVEEQYVGVYDILKAGTIVITEAAMQEIENRTAKNLQSKKSLN